MRERAKNPLPMKCCNGKKSRSDRMENKFAAILYVDNYVPKMLIKALGNFLMMSGLSKAQVFTLVVSQLGMFRGRFSNFETGRRLNMTDRLGEGTRRIAWFSL